MQLIAGGKGKRGALDCNHGGLREQESAQPVAEGVQGAAGDGDAGAIEVEKCLIRCLCGEGAVLTRGQSARSNLDASEIRARLFFSASVRVLCKVAASISTPPYHHISSQ